MIQAVREWLLSIIMTSFLISLLRVLLPEGNLRKIGAFTGSLVLLSAILRPLVRLEPEWPAWDMASYESEIAKRMDELNGRQADAFRAQVAEASAEAIQAKVADASAEMIQQKAAELGASVSAAVTVRTENETPLPWSVTLDGAWNAALSEWIRVALDIPPERQEWREIIQSPNRTGDRQAESG